MLSSTVTSIFTGSVLLEDECKVLGDYVIGQRLGEGAYGSVYVVKYIPSGESFALKILQKDDLFMHTADEQKTNNNNNKRSNSNTNDMGRCSNTSVYGSGDDNPSSLPPIAPASFAYSIEKLIVQEATVMQSLEHPHVVKLYKFLNSTVALYFIMELAEGGELFDLIISKRYFSENEARYYFQQLISAIDYCHRNGVAHKDLKAENLLLGKDNRLVVCDFGFSSKMLKRNVDDPDNVATATGSGDAGETVPDDELDTMFGTLHYMSPEAVLASTTNKTFDDAVMTDIGQCSPLGVQLGDTSLSFPARHDVDVMEANQLNTGTYDSFYGGYSNHSLGRTLRSSMSTSMLDHMEDEECPQLHLPSSKTNNNHNSSSERKKTGRFKAFMRSFMGGGGGSELRKSQSAEHLCDMGHFQNSEPVSTDFSKAQASLALSATAGGSGTFTNNTANTKKDKNRKSAGAGKAKRIVVSTVSSPLAVHHDPNSATTLISRSKQVIVDPFQQDLWSAGVILYFMLTGRLPFDGRDDEETLHLIQTCEVSWAEEEISRISCDARGLVERMLSAEPTDRPTVEQIIETKWFTRNLDVEHVFPHRELLAAKLKERGLVHGSGGSNTNGTNGGGMKGNASRSAVASSSFLDFSAMGTHHVTEDDENALLTAFQKIDADGYGKITRDQVRDMLTVLHGDMVTKEEVSELVNLFTGDPQSKEITFNQFRDAWVNKDLAHIPFTHSSEFQLANIIGTQMDDVERQVVRQLRIAFDSVDVSGKGVIELEELRRVFEQCAIDVQEEELVSLMRYFYERDLLVKSSAVKAVGDSGLASPAPPQQQHMYICFDSFVMGIVQREILLRHPLGRKLAAATNLTALFNSRNVTECVRHGFLVIGLQNVVLEKLASVPERLRLLYSDEVVSNTENIYSFRYLGSSALLKGATMKTVSPMLVSSAMPMSASAHNHQPPLSSSLSNAPQLSSSASHRSRQLHDQQAQAHRWLSNRGSASTNAGALTHNAAPSVGDFYPGGARSRQGSIGHGGAVMLVSPASTTRSGVTTKKKSIGSSSPRRHRNGCGSTVSTHTTTKSKKAPTTSVASSSDDDGNIGSSNYTSCRGTSSVVGSSEVTPTTDGLHVVVDSAYGKPPASGNTTRASASPAKKRITTKAAPSSPERARPKITASKCASPTRAAKAGASSGISGSKTKPPTSASKKPVTPLKSSATAPAFPLSSPQRSRNAKSVASSEERERGNATALPYAASMTHRALAFGGSGAVPQVNGLCDVDVILAPACLGYCLVQFRRIHGKTSDFHEAVAFISNLLDFERQQAIEDTMPRGESELM